MRQSPACGKGRKGRRRRTSAPPPVRHCTCPRRRRLQDACREGGQSLTAPCQWQWAGRGAASAEAPGRTPLDPRTGSLTSRKASLRETRAKPGMRATRCPLLVVPLLLLLATCGVRVAYAYAGAGCSISFGSTLHSFAHCSSPKLTKGGGTVARLLWTVRGTSVSRRRGLSCRAWHMAAKGALPQSTASRAACACACACAGPCCR